MLVEISLNLNGARTLWMEKLAQSPQAQSGLITDKAYVPTSQWGGDYNGFEQAYRLVEQDRKNKGLPMPPTYVMQRQPDSGFVEQQPKERRKMLEGGINPPAAGWSGGYGYGKECAPFVALSADPRYVPYINEGVMYHETRHTDDTNAYNYMRTHPEIYGWKQPVSAVGYDKGKAIYGFSPIAWTAAMEPTAIGTTKDKGYYLNSAYWAKNLGAPSTFNVHTDTMIGPKSPTAYLIDSNTGNVVDMNHPSNQGVYDWRPKSYAWAPYVPGSPPPNGPNEASNWSTRLAGSAEAMEALVQSRQERPESDKKMYGSPDGKPGKDGSSDPTLAGNLAQACTWLRRNVIGRNRAEKRREEARARQSIANNDRIRESQGKMVIEGPMYNARQLATPLREIVRPHYTKLQSGSPLVTPPTRPLTPSEKVRNDLIRDFGWSYGMDPGENPCDMRSPAQFAYFNDKATDAMAPTNESYVLINDSQLMDKRLQWRQQHPPAPTSEQLRKENDIRRVQGLDYWVP